MYSKTYRPTQKDLNGIKEIIANDPRIEKGQSQALYYAFKDAAQDIKNEKLDWKKISQHKFDDDSHDTYENIEYAAPSSFSVEESDWETVKNSFKEQLGVERIRISYLVRLCIAAARIRLTEQNEPTEDNKTQITNIDGVELLNKVNNKAVELILSGNTEKIMKFLEE